MTANQVVNTATQLLAGMTTMEMCEANGYFTRKDAGNYINVIFHFKFEKLSFFKRKTISNLVNYVSKEFKDIYASGADDKTVIKSVNGNMHYIIGPISVEGGKYNYLMRKVCERIYATIAE